MKVFLLIATVLGVFGPTFFLSRKLKVSWRISFFIAINLIIIQLYIFALFGLLRLGLYFIFLSGAVMFLLSKKKIDLLQNFNYFPTKILWCLPTLLLIRAIPNDFRFTMSDEFPSWAANVKTLFFENRLGDINSATRSIFKGFYQSYPPAQELIQYYFLQGFGWSEANVMRAQVVTITSALIFIFSLAFKERHKFGFVGYITSLIVFYLFGFGFSNILADGLLAIYFTTALVLILNSDKLKYAQILISLLIGLNILIKPMGSTLAAILILVSVIVLRPSRFDRNNLDNKQLLSHQFVKITKTGFQIATLPLAMYLSWQIHLRRIKVTPGAEYPSISKILSPEFQLRWEKTWEAYKNNFFGSLYGPDNLAGISTTAPGIVRILHISLFSIVVILSLIQFGLASLEDSNHRKIRIKIAFVILFSAIAYQVFLLFLYMFFFGEYEGESVAALVRYSVSFLLGWTILVLVLILHRIEHLKLGNYYLAIVLITAFIIAPSNFYNDFKRVNSIPEKLTARLDVERLVPATLQIITPNDSIYYIYQKSTGVEKYMFGYLILPNKSNWGCWSVGQPYGPQDVWTCNQSISKLLIGYDYLVVGNGDNNFWNEASPYLNEGSLAGRQGVYKVSFPGKKLQITQVMP